MPYTFIVLTPDRTDRSSKTFTFPKAVVWFLIAFFVLSAPVTYYVSLHYVAPKFWMPKTGEMMVELESLREDFVNLEIAHNELTQNHTALEATNKQNAQGRAEAETRLSLAENARGQSARRVQELEEELVSMERKMAFYEKLVTPETEEEVLQCFNIGITKKGKTLDYGINFLKHDQSDASRVDTKVKFKVMYGESMMNLQEEPEVKEDREVDMWVTKSRRLRGSLVTNVPENGLHILDVKAYDTKTDKVIAHCWKAF